MPVSPLRSIPGRSMERPRDESCREIPGPRANGHDRELPVDRDDTVTGPPLVRGTLRSRDLLNPRSGGEACRIEPSRCVSLELLARVPGPGDAQHELREAFGKEGSLLDAPADLRGGDFRAVLGVQPRVSLAEQAGSEESRNGQRKDERYRYNLPRSHARPRSGTRPVEHGDHSPPPPSPGGRRLLARCRMYISWLAWWAGITQVG